MRKNKKGIVDILLVGVFILAFAISIIVGWIVLDGVFTELNGTRDTIGEEGLQQMNQSYNKYVSIFNVLPLMILVFLFLGVIISTFWIDTHPAFFFISVFLLIIFTILFYIFGQVWFDMTTQNEILNESANEFGALDYVMDNFVIFTVLFGFLVLIVLYGKFGGFRG